ncbi:winged helix-turn-helix domain-containing protein [Agrobacterium rubi]|uniref:winged helix-turn-helix domain-containing protein n=1 Tax=Agrobacterium rubi TaxID=28099 RepID=UPI001574D8F4|nr:ArsR family transcriptional regulator [Agrobacterium rubi]NTF03160.1 ArsR family transcriptional regulator [Agrobacterium rubi]
MPEIDALPAKRNSVICPCCLQFVEGASILVDPINGSITNGGNTIRLQPQHFKMAKYLLDCFPMTATNQGIYDSVFADDASGGPEAKIINVIICKIRPELAGIGFAIETVWGTGYRLVEANPSESVPIKERSIRNRMPGSAQRWNDDHGKQLSELIASNLKVSQIATIMKMPYAAVERHMKALKEQVSA